MRREPEGVRLRFDGFLRLPADAPWHNPRVCSLVHRLSSALTLLLSSAIRRSRDRRSLFLTRRPRAMRRPSAPC